MKEIIEDAIRATITTVPGLDKLPPIKRFDIIADATLTIYGEFLDRHIEAKKAEYEDELLN